MKKNDLRQILPFHLDYLLRIYLLGIFSLGLFRLLQFLTEYARIAGIPAGERFPVFLKAFWMGFRFDTVISGYILLLPFFLLTVFYALKLSREIPWRWIHRYLLLMYGVALAVFAIDIPYFHQFFSPFSMAAFQWMDFPGFIIKMIIQEPRYFWTIFPYLFLMTGFYFLARQFFRSSIKIGVSGKAFPGRPAEWLRYGLFSLLFLFLLFTGIRGRLAQKSPIRVGTAYFSPYVFPNQLGLNPVFTFIRSALDAGKEKTGPLN